jgi:type II secretory pathway component PulK
VRDVAQGGALESLSDLTARSGLTPEQTASLGEFLNALPVATAVNLNTASTEVLSAFLADPSTVERFAALRARRNRLTWSDLDGMGLILPAGAGLDSTVFAADIRVDVGTTRRRSRLLVIQSPDPQGQPSAQVLRRWLD